jgi:protease II
MFGVDPNNDISPVIGNFPLSHYQSENKLNGSVFAPTHPSAKQIVEVREGRYKPTAEDVKNKVAFWKYEITGSNRADVLCRRSKNRSKCLKNTNFEGGLL